MWYLELILKNEKLSRQEIKFKALTLLKNGNQRICKLVIGYAQFIQKINKNLKVTESKETGELKISIKNKNYIIPKTLVALFGLSGVILYIIKKLNLFKQFT